MNPDDVDTARQLRRQLRAGDPDAFGRRGFGIARTDEFSGITSGKRGPATV